MSFPSGPSSYRFTRVAPSRHRESGPIHAVGHRVLVVAPDGARVVTLVDDAAAALGTVPHGSEVEVLAWQPAGPHGTRYRVQSPKDRVEGWLLGRHLRACERPVAVKAVAPVRRPTTAAKRTAVSKPAPRASAGR